MNNQENKREEVSKCCSLCEPNTLEKKAGLDNCRITMCGCHYSSQPIEANCTECQFEKGHSQECSKYEGQKPFEPKEEVGEKKDDGICHFTVNPLEVKEGSKDIEWEHLTDVFGFLTIDSENGQKVLKDFLSQQEAKIKRELVDKIEGERKCECSTNDDECGFKQYNQALDYIIHTLK